MLLLQDLAVVVLLMLIPLLAPSDSGTAGFSKIARALGVAALKVWLRVDSMQMCHDGLLSHRWVPWLLVKRRLWL